jgi:hypothetical protein
MLRGGLEDWTDSPTGLMVPRAVRTVDDSCFHPERLYSKADFKRKQEELNRIRREAIGRFGDKLNLDTENMFQ